MEMAQTFAELCLAAVASVMPCLAIVKVSALVSPDARQRTAANQEAGFRIQRPAEAVRKTGIPVSEIGVLAAGSNRRQPMNRSLLSRYKNIHCYCLYNPYPA